jgi:transposase
MIVIGVDVHKHSLTAVAVDERGRLLAERTLQSAEDGLLAWASELDSERLWAVEDCRHVTRRSSANSSRPVSGCCECRRS